MSNALITRACASSYVRHVRATITTPEAVKRAVWAARDLGLISQEKLDRVFGRTIEVMKREDFEDLSEAMHNLAEYLSTEADKR